MGVLQGRAEGNAAIGELSGKRIGIWCIDVGIPPHERMAPGVRQRQHVSVGLHKHLCSIATDDGEERIPVRLPKSRRKPQLVAVKSNSLIDIADNEKW